MQTTIQLMQSIQFKEIVGGFGDKNLESLNKTLRDIFLEKEQNSDSHNFLCEISPELKEIRTNIKLFKNVDVSNSKLKQIYSLPDTFSGGNLVIRENSLAKYIVFGSGRPVISYTVGYLETNERKENEYEKLIMTKNVFY